MFVTERGLLKVGDFGTSRFLEIAAHGTTVIGSPPYMAPEQFEGRAVFASDLYSLGVTMYQMLTGALPYDTPAPSDLDRLRRGELVSSPRPSNPSIPQAIDDIIMRALQGRTSRRATSAPRTCSTTSSRRAARSSVGRVRPRAAAGALLRPSPRTAPPARRRPRRVAGRASRPSNRFCWHCRKPLPARSGRCPFCGETPVTLDKIAGPSSAAVAA